MDPVVKLVVKAPNQQIEDQVLDIDLKWTVLDLKKHISNHYPSKPVSIVEASDAFHPISLHSSLFLSIPVFFSSF